MAKSSDEEAGRRRAFGQALKSARAAKGLTQVQLAEALGIRQPTVAGYEAAQSVPDVLELFEIEKALGVKPGALSKHLGFLPTEAVRTVCSMKQAIEDDPHLNPEDKRLLLATYRRMAPGA